MIPVQFFCRFQACNPQNPSLVPIFVIISYFENKVLTPTVSKLLNEKFWSVQFVWFRNIPVPCKHNFPGFSCSHVNQTVECQKIYKTVQHRIHACGIISSTNKLTII